MWQLALIHEMGLSAPCQSYSSVWANCAARTENSSSSWSIFWRRRISSTAISSPALGATPPTPLSIRRLYEQMFGVSTKGFVNSCRSTTRHICQPPGPYPDSFFPVFSGGDEQRVPGCFDQLRAQRRLRTPRRRDVHESLEQVSRVVSAQGPPTVQRANHVQGTRIGRDRQPLSLPLEDAAPHLPRRVGHQHLVREPAQVSLVQQLGRLEVRRQRQLRPERHLHLAAARRKVHVVDLLLEWHQKTVEDLLRRHALPSEVVDEKHPAIGFHLERSSVRPAAFLPRRVEHLDLKLAAHLHQRSRDAPPAAVRRLVRLQPMEGRVENRHHLAAADIEGHWDDDRVAEKTWDSAREGGLAVARRAVDEDRRA